MKRCPECGRDYNDDSMSFCLDDGSELLFGPGSFEGPQTAILHETAPPNEAATRAYIHTTAAEAEPRESLDGSTERRSLSAHRAAEPRESLAGVSERRSMSANGVAKPLIAVVLAAVLLTGGFFGYRYFAAGGSGQIESLAVMPFVNEAGNPELDYLSDGMAETLISSLSQLPNLNIKPRSMVFRYKGKDVGPETIGKELSVQAVLLGRVLQRGADLSLFVELIDVTSTKVIWSRQYNRRQSDLVSLQSEIARDVSGKLKSGLSGEEEKRVTQTGTEDPEAYRLYLLGRSLAERRKERDARKAIEHFEQAIARDPNYTAAYLGLSQATQFTALYGNAPANEVLPKTRAVLLRAREIAPDLPEVHVGLAANELFLLRNFAASEAAARRALELDPKYSGAHRVSGLRLAFLGRLDESLAAFKRAVELDPTNATARINYAWSLYYLGRRDESDRELKAVQELEPSSWFVEFQMFINSRGRRDHSAAIEHLARAMDLRDEPEAAKFIRDSFSSGGWNGMMRSVIADPGRSKVWDYYIGTFAAELGDKDAAFSFLNRSADKYDQFVLFAKIDPAMEPLRTDPRYGELLKKLGLQ